MMPEPVEMEIYCIDNSDGRLWLAADFLAYLCSIGSVKSVQVTTDARQQYAALEKLISGLKFTTEKRAHYHIEFSGSALQAVSADLIYPIVSVAHKLKGQGQIIPLSTQVVAGCINIGELESGRLLVNRLFSQQDLTGLSFLVSGGPTAEDLDPVRFLSNRSSGKMGIALASAAFERGARVELVLGATTVQPPRVLQTTRARSAAEMAQVIKEKFKAADVYVGTAAIADYRPQVISKQKIKKSPGPRLLKLERTTDVIKDLAASKSGRTVVGFSVETTAVIENSLKKLESKNLDMIVVNNPMEQGSAFAVDTNKVSILHKNGKMFNLPLLNKNEVAHAVLDHIKRARGLNG